MCTNNEAKMLRMRQIITQIYSQLKFKELVEQAFSQKSVING